MKHDQFSLHEDDNVVSTFVDNIFNPIFLVTSSKNEREYATELTYSVGKDKKKVLDLKILLSFAAFLMSGNSFLKATSTCGRIVYGVLSADFFRTSYNCFLKNHCKIICEQNMPGFGLRWLSRFALLKIYSKIVSDEEEVIKPDVFYYRTITLSSYKTLQQVCVDIHL